MSSALEVFTTMRYINRHYLSIERPFCDSWASCIKWTRDIKWREAHQPYRAPPSLPSPPRQVITVFGRRPSCVTLSVTMTTLHSHRDESSAMMSFNSAGGGNTLQCGAGRGLLWLWWSLVLISNYKFRCVYVVNMQLSADKNWTPVRLNNIDFRQNDSIIIQTTYLQ